MHKQSKIVVGTLYFVCIRTRPSFIHNSITLHQPAQHAPLLILNQQKICNSANCVHWKQSASLHLTEVYVQRAHLFWWWLKQCFNIVSSWFHLRDARVCAAQSTFPDCETQKCTFCWLFCSSSLWRSFILFILMNDTESTVNEKEVQQRRTTLQVQIRVIVIYMWRKLAHTIRRWFHFHSDSIRGNQERTEKVKWAVFVRW